jgi:hypothetical protein
LILNEVSLFNLKKKKEKEESTSKQLTLLKWINCSAILSTVEDGMANPTPAEVPA